MRIFSKAEIRIDPSLSVKQTDTKNDISKVRYAIVYSSKSEYILVEFFIFSVVMLYLLYFFNLSSVDY